jgi:hypothetical protein
MQQPEKVSLATLRGGAAVEQFDAELLRVLENVVDINTDGKTRTVTLAVKITPDKNRSFCAVEVCVSSKLRPNESFETQMYLGMQNGLPFAMEHNPEQMTLELNSQVTKSSLPVIQFPIAKEN